MRNRCAGIGLQGEVELPDRGSRPARFHLHHTEQVSGRKISRLGIEQDKQLLLRLLEATQPE
jgi:hypothetical protein